MCINYHKKILLWSVCRWKEKLENCLKMLTSTTSLVGQERRRNVQKWKMHVRSVQNYRVFMDKYANLWRSYRRRRAKACDVFEPRTATGSEVFFYLTCLHTTTVTLLSIFSLVETISSKIWERPLSWQAKCSLPFSSMAQKRRMLKLPDKLTWYRKI